MRLHPDIVHRREEFGGIAFHLETKRFYPLNHAGYWLLQEIEDGESLPRIVQSFRAYYRRESGSHISRVSSGRIAGNFLNNLIEAGIVLPENDRKSPVEGSKAEELKDAALSGFDLYENPLRSPLVVSLSVIFQCNLLCTHCYVTSTSEVKPDNLTRAEVIEILSGLAEAAVFDVVITGGEPLLFDGIYDVVQHAKDLGLYVCLNTNGTLVTQRKADKVKRTGVDVVKVSLDSPHSIIHDEFRGQVRSFERSTIGIRRLVDAGVRVDTHTVVSRQSLASREDLEKLLELGARLGITQMHFGRVFSTGRSTDELKLARDHVVGMIRQLHELKEKGHPLVGRLPSTAMPNVPSIPEYDGCGQCARSNYAYVAYNGEVYPCTNLYKSEWCLGSLRRSSLNEILEESTALTELNSKMQPVRNSLSSTNVGIHV